MPSYDMLQKLAMEGALQDRAAGGGQPTFANTQGLLGPPVPGGGGAVPANSGHPLPQPILTQGGGRPATGTKPPPLPVLHWSGGNANTGNGTPQMGTPLEARPIDWWNRRIRTSPWFQQGGTPPRYFLSVLSQRPALLRAIFNTPDLLEYFRPYLQQAGIEGPP